MSNSARPLVLSALVVLGAGLLACQPGSMEDPPRGNPTGGTGGSGEGGSGGTAARGGAGGSFTGGSGGGAIGGSGGSAPGAGGSGGSAPGTGGNPGNGGGAGTDARPGTGGAGGASQSDGGRDAGGSTAEGGSGQTGGPAKPSAGCGKANPPSGARTVMTGGRTGNFIVTLPAGYDPAKPTPLGFAFHGYGLNEKTCAAGPECPGFKDLKAITVYPKSIGAGWESPLNLLAPNIKFFEDIVAVMKAEYCVDENRIFVAGVSSGGQFVEHLSCRFGDQLWAVSPIAAYVDRGVDTDCKGAPAQIVIHGITDNLVRNGHAVRDLYARRNGCPTVPATLADAEARMKTAFDARRAEYACVDYQGCTRAPLRYCVFSQITYNGLTHGFPRVGGMLIGEFLGTVK